MRLLSREDTLGMWGVLGTPKDPTTHTDGPASLLLITRMKMETWGAWKGGPSRECR